jgi:hypothetical protein
LRFKASPSKEFIRPLSQTKPFIKKSGGVAQGVGPEFKPQYCKKIKNIITTKKSKLCNMLKG